ncbi:Ig-like domain-containing protein [Undibacterium sp. CY18W]|uniref:Ig-like domain-containing protein n=1 Tax=Undibacterium hunanense TaxID=2762292 RepID=A0ABR6ZVW9_9BURK|nr:Ig-like domain-containing protein [Undibacterium hunanense]MBC3919960.1 Ig-like domain-containing protein [Undibacterium hunanense]
MIFYDMPQDAGAHASPPAIIARANEKKDVAKTLTIGGFIAVDAKQKFVAWDVAKVACDELRSAGWFREPAYKKKAPDCQVKLVEKKPEHGKLEQLAGGSYQYTPAKGFFGVDKVQFIVDAEGKKVRLMWSTSVLESEPKK